MHRACPASRLPELMHDVDSGEHEKTADPFNTAKPSNPVNGGFRFGKVG